MQQGRFDTVIVFASEDAAADALLGEHQYIPILLPPCSNSSEGTRVGCVCVTTSKKIKGVDLAFPTYWPKVPMAYVKWYTKPTLPTAARATHNMPALSKAMDSHGDPQWSIIPLANV